MAYPQPSIGTVTGLGAVRTIEAPPPIPSMKLAIESPPISPERSQIPSHANDGPRLARSADLAHRRRCGRSARATRNARASQRRCDDEPRRQRAVDSGRTTYGLAHAERSRCEFRVVPRPLHEDRNRRIAHHRNGRSHGRARRCERPLPHLTTRRTRPRYDHGSQSESREDSRRRAAPHDDSRSDRDARCRAHFDGEARSRCDDLDLACERRDRNDANADGHGPARRRVAPRSRISSPLASPSQRALSSRSRSSFSSPQSRHSLRGAFSSVDFAAPDGAHADSGADEHENYRHSKDLGRYAIDYAV